MSNFETERQEKSETRFARVQRNGAEEMKSVIPCGPSEIVAKGERIRSERNHIGDISRKIGGQRIQALQNAQKMYYALTHRKKKKMPENGAHRAYTPAYGKNKDNPSDYDQKSESSAYALQPVGCVMCTPKRVPLKEVPMAEPISVRLSDELHAKISFEAEQKKCSASQIIREKIEQAFTQEEAKQEKQTLGRMEAKLIEIAPRARRAEKISCWTLLFLAEITKRELSPEAFRDVRKAVDEIFSEYLKTGEIKF